MYPEGNVDFSLAVRCPQIGKHFLAKEPLPYKFCAVHKISVTKLAKKRREENAN